MPHNVTAIDSRDVGVALESSGIQCAGVIVQNLAEQFSHHEAVESLDTWCKRYGVPGITGVDTRAITTLLRDEGTTLGRIAVGVDAALPAPAEHEYQDPSQENLVAQVSTREPYTLNPSGSVKIAVLDFGNKANILRCLVRRDAAVTVLPWNFDFNTIRNGFDGLFLTNGPGDPTQCMEAALNVRKTLQEWNKPVFGICMGHQIIGIAAGLKSYRMRFGNRGHNQPVLALASSGSIKAGRVYVTRYIVFPSLAHERSSKLLHAISPASLAKITNTLLSFLTLSQKVGNPSLSIATTHRWRALSPQRNRASVFGACNSTLRVREVHWILSR